MVNLIEQYKEKKISVKDFVNIVILAIAAFILFGGKCWIILDGDLAGYGYSLYAIIGRVLSTEEAIPIWFPNIWGGVTGFHSIVSLFYPVAWVLGVIFYSHDAGTVTFEVAGATMIFHTFLLLAGTYGLCRVNDNDEEVSLFGAGVCALCGSLIQYRGWFTIYLNYAWAPILLMFLTLAIRSPKGYRSWYTVLAGIASAMFLLLAASTTAVLILIIWAGFYLVYIWTYRDDKKMILNITLCCLFAGIIAVGISAIYILPVCVLGADNYRYVNGNLGFLKSNEFWPFSVYLENPLDISSFQELGGFSGTLAIGLLAILSTIAGFFVKETDKLKKPFLLLGQWIIIVSLFAGYTFFFTDFFYYIPLVNQIREPFLFVGFLWLGVAIMGTYGIEALLKVGKKTLSNIFYNPTLLCGILGGIIILEILPHRFSWANIVNLILFIIYIGLEKKNWHRAWIKKSSFVMLIMMVIWNVLTLQNKLEQTCIFSTKEAAQKMKEVQESVLKIYEATEFPTEQHPFRISEYGTNVWTNNIMLELGGYDVGGYWNPIYGKTIEKHSKLNRKKSSLLENVKYWILPEGADEYFYNLVADCGFDICAEVSDVFNSYDTLETQNVKVYKNTEYEGPAWFVYNYITHSSEATSDSIYEMMNSEDVNLHDTVVIDEVDVLKVANVYNKEAINSVTMLSYRNNAIELSCETSEEGILVLTESDASGWQAYIDGEKTEILTVDFDRKGLIIVPGTHQIRLCYRPMSFVVGSIITGITIACILLCAMVGIVKKLLFNRKT